MRILVVLHVHDDVPDDVPSPYATCSQRCSGSPHLAQLPNIKAAVQELPEGRKIRL
jgi:hypothetical protein